MVMGEAVAILSEVIEDNDTEIIAEYKIPSAYIV